MKSYFNQVSTLRDLTVLPSLMRLCGAYTGVSENRGPEYSTLSSRILIIRTPK